MKSVGIFNKMIKGAEKIEDKENAIIIVPDTLSRYIRKQIKEHCHRYVQSSLCDYEFGFIDEKELADKIANSKIVSKSVDFIIDNK